MMSAIRVYLRRAIVPAVVTVQALAIYPGNAPHHVFGYHMFPEASTWKAEIVRVTASGERISIREPWPGGYRWETMVQRRGLGGDPSDVRHADSGIGPTLDFLKGALDWVASNTPRDTETQALEATVTYWQNTRGPTTVVLKSHDRHEVIR